jgi:mono/diheme cytochrome c family protein
MSKRAIFGVLATAFLAAAITSGGASADPAAGKSLAQKWCAECHSIGGDQLSPNLAAPTFAELAAEPSITEYTLRAFLRTPHETMPNIKFTPEQMDDIVGYIISLKPHH